MGAQITDELDKDKYLVLGLALALLAIYLYNPAPVIENLLMMVVGGFLTAIRAGSRPANQRKGDNQ